MQSSNIHILQRCGCQKCGPQYSRKSVDWLEFISKTNDIYIQHALNDGEYRIPTTSFKADGFCKETNTIYEFNGDYWHGNPSIYNYNDKSYFSVSFGELYQKTLRKENIIKELGYNLITIWESDWMKLNKSIKKFQQKFRKLKKKN